MRARLFAWTIYGLFALVLFGGGAGLLVVIDRADDPPGPASSGPASPPDLISAEAGGFHRGVYAGCVLIINELRKSSGADMPIEQIKADCITLANTVMENGVFTDSCEAWVYSGYRGRCQ